VVGRSSPVAVPELGGHEYVLLLNAAVTYRRADVRLVAVRERRVDVAIPDA
jgi:hypothetical protein